MTVSSCVLTPQERGGKGAWTVQAAATPSESARTRQPARARPHVPVASQPGERGHAERAHGRTALPGETELAPTAFLPK